MKPHRQNPASREEKERKWSYGNANETNGFHVQREVFGEPKRHVPTNRNIGKHCSSLSKRLRARRERQRKTDRNEGQRFTTEQQQRKDIQATQDFVLRKLQEDS